MALLFLVDDEEPDRIQMREILEREDHTIIEAGTYQEALAAFDSNRDAIELLISDISLPSVRESEDFFKHYRGKHAVADILRSRYEARPASRSMVEKKET